MPIRAILSKSTTDMIKSKVLSTELSQLTFDCYITPKEFAKIIQDYYDTEFTLELNGRSGA